MPQENPPFLTIVLNVMGRVELAEYGFRSWMLQETDHPYEVVLNLFNDKQARFEELAHGRNPNCRSVINTYPQPAFFNISVANNLGIFASTGSNIFFTPADTVFPSSGVNTLKREAVDRGLVYCVGARWELTPEGSGSLRPADQYSRSANFDWMSGFEGGTDLYFRGWGHGWLVRRDVIHEIGGFDSAVIFAEDKDLNDRARHYIQRKGLQQCVHALGLFGYHLHHPISELFRASSGVMPLLRDRNAKLLADPNGNDDVIPSHLDSREQLLKDLNATQVPAAQVKYQKSLMTRILWRMRRTAQALRGDL